MGETVFIGKYLTIGLILPLGFLAYSILFSIAYFSKERMDNYENKVYKWILIDGLALLIMEFVNTVAYYLLPEYWAKFELRFYLMMFVGYLELISTYMAVISRTKEDVEKNFKKITTFHAIIFGFCVILIWTGDITYVTSRYGLGADGTATSLPTAFDALICLILWIINIKRNARKISKVKYIPFFAYLVGSFALGAVQVQFPGFLLITPLVNFTNTILYFTVENPDMKIINQLTLAKSSAEKASRAKTEFLSSMSHEIRTPLNAVIGFSECIKSAPTLEDAQEDANEIVKASNTLLELVNGIIDFSKIEDGNLEIQEVSYKPREVFSSLSKLVTPKMNEKNLKFTLNISKDVPETLFGDKENIRKVVTNLLTNAYKYTEKGSVEFSINAENKNEKCNLIISVKDTGHGIKKENIEGIFKSFERLEEDKDGVTSGTGLGLAITKQLVDTMKGKIEVESTYGEGSTFTVIIEQKIEQLSGETTQDITTDFTGKTEEAPVKEQVVVQPEVQSQVVQTVEPIQPVIQVQPAVVTPPVVVAPPVVEVTPQPVQAAMPAIAQPNTAPVVTTQPMENVTATKNSNGSYTLNLDGKTFLLIDDNVLNLKIASKLLEKMNAHDITTMTNGYELIEKIKNGQKYDVIISDDMMPEISGTETLAELKKIPGFSTPVIVLTANAMEGMREEYLQKGFDEYIAKPINREILSEILVKILNDPNIIVKNDEQAAQMPVVQQQETVDTTNGDAVTFLKNNGVDIEKSLEILGDIKMYNMTMSDFLVSVGPRKDRMIEFKDKNDMKNYAIDVHSLKSDSKYLGFNTLATICSEHEVKSKENDAKYIWADFPRLEEALNKALEIANTYAKNNNIVPNQPVIIPQEQIIPDKEVIEISPESQKAVEIKRKNTLNLENKKIVLLDDNAINLKIEKKLLEKMNAHDITVMSSGYELIEKVKSGEKYDLIISDDMMPIISGSETLTELKKIPGFSIPVVVLTANVFDGIREEYLKKGFDEYLAKPVNKDSFEQIIEKTLNDPSIIVPVVEQEDENAIDKELEDNEPQGDANSSAVYNKLYLRNNGVNLRESIQILGDISTYNTALADFLESIDARKNRMIEYKNQNDMKNYAIDVHSLKSDSLYLGFTQLAIIAQEHEIKSKENDTKYICEDYPQIEQELNRVLEIVNNYAKYNNLI